MCAPANKSISLFRLYFYAVKILSKYWKNFKNIPALIRGYLFFEIEKSELTAVLSLSESDM